MPPPSPRLLQPARATNSLLPQLLPVTRDLRSAQNELRWLQEHAQKGRHEEEAQRLLNQHVSRRSRGEPLQYILGSEFFGDVEIKCRPGVLIPRQETAASVSYLVSLLLKGQSLPQRLSMLDLCSGSGCIPLLFHHKFYSEPAMHNSTVDFIGADISEDALQLARENQSIQASSLSPTEKSPASESLRGMKFMQANVLRGELSTEAAAFPTIRQAIRQHFPTRKFKDVDILISNPPYISSKDYGLTTTRSVRDYEPKLALVPPPYDPTNQPASERLSRKWTSSETSKLAQDDNGDLFYTDLLRHAHRFKAKVALFEVADLDQAKRVTKMAVHQSHWKGIEIWRDDPADISAPTQIIKLYGKEIPIIGSGNGRSVLLYHGKGQSWIGKKAGHTSTLDVIREALHSREQERESTLNAVR